jgi:hypothetical protein
MNRLRIATRSVRRESAHGYGYALRWFLLRFYLRFLRRRRDALPAASDDDERHPITIVIPAVDKDADVLDHCLRSVRTHIRNQVAALWVVAPESPAIRALAEAAGATLVPEDALLPRPARELKTRGWVLQQLIKLNACFHVPTADYLVLDADTVFLRPQCFVRGGKAVLRYSDQYELLYNRSLQLVFGHARRFPVSFVTHHQLFSVERVKGLLALFEQRFGRPWWEAILHEVDQGHLISFSEYELYGHFVMAAPDWRRHVALQYWHGLDLDRADLPRLGEWEAGGIGLNSVSFHRHTQ